MAVTLKTGKPPVSSRRPSRSSFNMKRTNEWVLSTDIPSDIAVEAGGLSFALHKFPLVARSGRIRRLVVSNGESDGNMQVELPDVPGGSEAFDLAAKFCYGINFDITIYNVALLRCVAEYLEMTEDFGENNLMARTETFLNEVVLQNLADSVAVLHNCESLLPFAEDLKLVSRCIDAAATRACRDQIGSGLSRSQYNGSGRSDNIKLTFNTGPKVPVVEWWAEDLAVLRIDFYQRVLAAMRSKGLRCESIGGAVMHYAHRALKGIHKKQIARNDSKPPKAKVVDPTTGMENEQRNLVATIVNILPPEKDAVSCSFLFGLLRTSVGLDSNIACRLDIERRIGMQLEQATLDDLLIPSFSNTGDTLFDTDIVQRILVCFLQQDDNGDLSEDAHLVYESEGGGSPSQTALVQVSKLVDTYLAEIAPDANLTVAKFTALAEVLPEYARVVDDGLYRAIDVFLKAHPAVSELERKKLCKLMDCQKLSQEACMHAAQNERLPVQVVVQILSFEQLRLRSVMASVDSKDHQLNRLFSQRVSSTGNLSAAVSPKDTYASVRRENRELKLEVARIRMRLTELEKDHVNMKQDMEKAGGGSKFLSSVSKTISRLNPFMRRDSKDLSTRSPSTNVRHGVPQTPDHSHSGKPRTRRHSIS